MASVDVLQSPFRFNSDGSAAKVEQGSDAHMAQQLAALVRTASGDLPLAPTYGVGDLTFTEIDPAAIASKIADFHPDIGIEDIIIYQTATGRDAVEMVFTSKEADNA
jgi:phage baseplate assembly protein W